MTDHPADDILAELARPARDATAEQPHQQHLNTCPDCRTRMAVWQDIATVLHEDTAGQTAAPPHFDTLLGPALASGHAEKAGKPTVAVTAAITEEPARPRLRRGFARPWRVAGQLALRQAVLMPRIWAPLSAAGIVGAALLASAQTHEHLGARLFGAAVVLLMMFGGLLVASPRRDPRRELLFTLPVPPAAVFLARLTVVLCLDVTLAMICSVLVNGSGWWTVVSGWLGESLLAASLALTLSVRFAPAVGAAAGGALWLLGVLSGPQGAFTTPADVLVGPLLSTTPWTLALTVVLLSWAASTMRSYPEPRPSP